MVKLDLKIPATCVKGDSNTLYINPILNQNTCISTFYNSRCCKLYQKILEDLMSPCLMPTELFAKPENIKGKSVGLSYLLYNQLCVKRYIII